MSRTSLIIYDDQLTGLPISKAKQIKDTFDPMVKMLDKFEQQYNDIMSITDITKDVCAQAKRLRINIGKIRVDTGKSKDKAKEYLKIEDRAIMGVHNILVYAIKEKEDQLRLRENHFEILEQERLESLQNVRASELAPYVKDAHERSLGGMEQDVWEAYLTMKIKEHEDLVIAQHNAEQKRIDDAKKAKLKNDRELFLAKYDEYIPVDSDIRSTDLGSVSDEDYLCLLDVVEGFKVHVISERNKSTLRLTRKANLYPYIEYIDKQNLPMNMHTDPVAVIDHYFSFRDPADLSESDYQELLNAFKAMADTELQRRIAEAQQLEALRLETQASLEKERQEKEMLAQQLAIKEREEAQAALDLMAAEHDALQQAEKLAKEPIKKQLCYWVNSFTIPEYIATHQKKNTDTIDAKVGDIVKKFEAFKRWSLDEIKTL